MSATRPDVPFGRGAVAGLLAFVAGYLVTYVWQASRVRDALSGLNAIIQFFGGDTIPAWKAVGWLFFNAHFVRTHLPALGGTRTTNFIASGDFQALLYGVPVVVLLATGFLLAWLRPSLAVRDCAVSGGSVAIGYVGAAVVALFAFGATRGDASIAPDLVTGVLLAGVVYPVVFGAVGGALAGVVQSSERGTRETRAD